MCWFTETFIKSLDDKMNDKGTNKMWLSQKQTDICKKYMTPHSVYPCWWVVVGDTQYTVQEYTDYGRITRCDKRIGTR